MGEGIVSRLSGTDARAEWHRATRSEFLGALRAATREDHFTHTEITIDERYRSIGNWLYEVAYQAHIENRVRRPLSRPGLHMSTSATKPDAQELAAWAADSFDLMSEGALGRLRASGDQQLRHGVELLMHQEVGIAVRIRYRGPEYRHVSQQDVAHQLLHEKLDAWCAQYDPCKGPLGAYLAARVQTKSLRISGARAVGLAGEPFVADGATDDPIERVNERADAKHLVPPRAHWPPEIELQFGRGLSPSEAAKAAGIRANVHRSRTSRFIAKLRNDLGSAL